MANLLRREIKQAKPFDSSADEAFLNLQRTTDFLTRKVVDALKPFGITPPQYNVLRILRGAGKSGLINREIGERMLTFVPDVTRMLDRLEARNLICRERGIADRRLVTARITAEGLKLLAKLDKIFHDFHNRLLGGCNERELKSLIKMLEKLRRELIETDKTSVSER
ncbi:MAG: MarR family winged helix-turn-helix transcriptional regulator [Pyrinomonadaceae bacterium]